ncbi:hypothetical protein ABPG72_005215 [Tetrahymena utriculariae]
MQLNSEKANSIDITFKDVSMTVQTKAGQKQLLKNVSGICKHSEITAILGSSGAGKSTLLNSLCNRKQNNKTTQVSETIQANSTNLTFKNFSEFGSYVMQDDVLLETMTVRECLQFAANLKRVSGGERKRASIELDSSFTAYLLITELKRQAKQKGKTVIFTIHSPSSDIWSMFDRIMLLVDGRFIYQGGSNDQIIKHFSKISFQCPKLQIPVDYFMSIMHYKDSNTQSYPKYFQSYNSQMKQIVESEMEQKSDSQIIVNKYSTPQLYQISQIAKRAFNTVKRNPILFKACMFQAVVIGLIIGLIYLQMEDNQHIFQQFMYKLIYQFSKYQMDQITPLALEI